MEKKTLTVRELKLLLSARVNAENLKGVKLNERFKQAIGKPAQEVPPKALAIQTKVQAEMEKVYLNALVHHLKYGPRTAPLISLRDLTPSIPKILNEVEKMEGEKLDTEVFKLMKRFLRSSFKSLIKGIKNVVPCDQNPYDEYWRWIRTTVDLAADRGVSPVELLASEEANDEIIRRMYTKEQFLTFSKWTFSKVWHIRTLKKIFVEPIIAGMAETMEEFDKEDLREMRAKLEKEYIPQLRKLSKKIKPVVVAYLNEEVSRIYATA